MAQKAGIPKWVALVSMDQPQVLPLVHFEPHPLLEKDSILSTVLPFFSAQHDTYTLF